MNFRALIVNFFLNLSDSLVMRFNVYLCIYFSYFCDHTQLSHDKLCAKRKR